MAIHDQDYEQSDWRRHVAVSLTDYTSDELNLFAGVLDAALNEFDFEGHAPALRRDVTTTLRRRPQRRA